MAQVPAAEVDNGSQEVYIDLVTDQTGSLFLPVEFNGFPVMALVDSGSTASVIHPDVLSRVSWIADVHREHQSGQLRLADGGVVYTQGSVKLLLKLGTDSVPIQHDFIVAAIEAPVVVGLDFMRAHGCILNVTEGTLVVEDKVHMCSTMQHLPSCFRIAMAETVIVPPYSEMVIPGVVQGQAHFTEGLIENIESPLCDGHVALAKLVVNPAGGDIPLCVVNMGYQSAKHYEGMIIASCEPARVMSMVEEESSENDLNSDTEGVEDELPSYMSTVLDEYEHRLSGTGGSDEVTRMGISGDGSAAGGSDSGTEMGRSDCGTRMAGSGERTGACGLDVGTGMGRSGGRPKMGGSEGRTWTGRSDGGTGIGGSDGVSGTGQSDGEAGVSGSVGMGVETLGTPVQLQSEDSFSKCHQARWWKIDRVMRNAARDWR